MYDDGVALDVQPWSASARNLSEMEVQRGTRRMSGTRDVASSLRSEFYGDAQDPSDRNRKPNQKAPLNILLRFTILLRLRWLVSFRAVSLVSLLLWIPFATFAVSFGDTIELSLSRKYERCLWRKLSLSRLRRCSSQFWYNGHMSTTQELGAVDIWYLDFYFIFGGVIKS